MELVLARLAYFKARRAEVVQLKKAERGNELKSINKSISVLKRWVRELKSL